MDKSQARPKSYLSVHDSIKNQVSIVKKPLIISKELNAILKSQHQYEPNQAKHLSPIALDRLVRSVNFLLKTHYASIFNRQAIHLVSLQYIESEKRMEIERLDEFLKLHYLLEPFNSQDRSANNVHGLLLIQKEDFMDKVHRLPPSSTVAHLLKPKSDITPLLTSYDKVRENLISKENKIEALKEKLSQYNDILKLLTNSLSDPERLQQNLVISSNTEITTQINQLRILLSRLEYKLRDPKVKLQVSNTLKGLSSKVN
ncbi:BA75_00093T0 [Komagataella pastoris]|uniref:BA75_00093T0 n=1 Tax=Komagataella pastoris TaxID=4922 RepID=A0A1B2J587_PICPA|nr:BA75_00093T0 [Komagataella pastoris]